MIQSDFHGVILCGGSGSRLWPLSRQFAPKQFIRLTDERSLLQHALLRMGRACGHPPVLVCNEAHRFIVDEQASELGMPDIEVILEPCQRNTAPAILAATLRAMRHGEDPVMLVMPSDQLIDDSDALEASFAAAHEAADAGAIVVFGVEPTGPAAGYGYIQADSEAGHGTVRPVRCFVEKPAPALAAQLLGDGNYYWNSGMFVFKASVLVGEFEARAPELLSLVRQALADGNGNDAQFRLARGAFSACPDISLDYAVMEGTARAAVVPLPVSWSDVGAWDAVWAAVPKSAEGNAAVGDVLLEDTHNCLVHSTHRLVASIGLEDIIVVETADAVLVAHKNRAQEVKRLVEKFAGQHRCELEHHREVKRPWGAYDSLCEGPRYQIKRITVKPGASLSTQMHHHRAEHWVVVSGTARVRCGGRHYLLTENQSTYIPLGEVHSLENPGKIPLEVIEVQSGAYLGEDDIVRYGDAYGRS